MTSLRSRITTAALTMTLGTGALAAPVLEPATQKFIDSLAGSKPIYTLSPQAARGVLLSAQSGPVALAPVSAEDRVLPVGPNRQDAHSRDPSGTRRPHPSGDSLLPRCRMGDGR